MAMKYHHEGSDERRRRFMGSGINFSNPLYIFVFIWAFALWLAQLKLVPWSLGVNRSILILIGMNCVTFALIYYAISLRFPAINASQERPFDLATISYLRKFTNKLYLVWGCGSLMNVIVCGGFPLLWIFMGNGKTYIDFGLPTVSGLINACGMMGMTAMYLDFLLSRRWKALGAVLVVILWQVVTLNRGAFIWALFQLLAIYLLMNRMALRRFIKGIVVIVMVVALFGFLGEFRNGFNQETKSNSFSSTADEVFDVLPSGSLWVYIYVTTGINNVVNAIDSIEPSFIPNYSLINIFPTIIRNLLYDTTKYPLELVSSGWNVSTFYAGYLADFGICGAILCVAILQLVTVIFYVNARRYRVWAMLAYAALFQAVILSVFWDTFTSLVTICQLMFACILRSRLQRVKSDRAIASC